MSTIIDGKAVSDKIRKDIKNSCADVLLKFGKAPTLAIVVAGNNPASAIYVNSKAKACVEAGMNSVLKKLPENVSQSQLENTVKELCDDPNVNGIMVQLPLPDGLNPDPVLELIPYEKDVDGLTAISAGRAFHGENSLLPCTPKGIIRLLKEYQIPTLGKHAVIIGRSNLVGKPLSVLLLNENCTVTICHSKTENLSSITKTADILVVAIGKDRFVTADMVKPGATVIDVGINRTTEGLHGDVDFESVKDVAGYITPVPGGVGPMTVTMLMLNTIEAFFIQQNK